jgi:hypothetical protein
MTVINFWPSWLTWLREEQRKDELFRLIRSGEKHTTIREKPKTGRYWQLYYGRRGGKKELIAEVEPKGVMPLKIDSLNQKIYLPICDLGDQLLQPYSRQEIIGGDGFKDHEEAFYAFFAKYGGKVLFLHEWERPIERDITGWRIEPKR